MIAHLLVGWSQTFRIFHSWFWNGSLTFEYILCVWWLVFFQSCKNSEMNCQWPTGASAVSCLYSLEPTRLRCVTFCYSNSPLLLSFSSAVLCVFLRIFRLASCFPRVFLTFLRVPPCFFVFLRVSSRSLPRLRKHGVWHLRILWRRYLATNAQLYPL